MHAAQHQYSPPSSPRAVASVRTVQRPKSRLRELSKQEAKLATDSLVKAVSARQGALSRFDVGGIKHVFQKATKNTQSRVDRYRQKGDLRYSAYLRQRVQILNDLQGVVLEKLSNKTHPMVEFCGFVGTATNFSESEMPVRFAPGQNISEFHAFIWKDHEGNAHVQTFYNLHSFKEDQLVVHNNAESRTVELPKPKAPAVSSTILFSNGATDYGLCIGRVGVTEENSAGHECSGHCEEASSHKESSRKADGHSHDHHGDHNHHDHDHHHKDGHKHIHTLGDVKLSAKDRDTITQAVTYIGAFDAAIHRTVLQPGNPHDQLTGPYHQLSQQNNATYMRFLRANHKLLHHVAEVHWPVERQEYVCLPRNPLDGIDRLRQRGEKLEEEIKRLMQACAGISKVNVKGKGLVFSEDKYTHDLVTGLTGAIGRFEGRLKGEFKEYAKFY